MQTIGQKSNLMLQKPEPFKYRDPIFNRVDILASNAKHTHI